MINQISFVIPKGSLEEQTLKYLKLADLEVKRASTRDYSPVIKDLRISRVKILRPQEIPIYVEAGYFDLGITGLDWVLETGTNVKTVAELPYSKRESDRVKIVLAVHEKSDVSLPAELKPNSKVSTEYPNLTKKYFERLGLPVNIFLSYGATEAKVPDIMDAIVDITETGETIRRSGLKIIDVILESSTVLIANINSYNEKRQSIEEIKTLILGAMDAEKRVLIKLNIPQEKLEDVIMLLPTMKAPSVSKLYNTDYYAVESVVEKEKINELIPKLKRFGAEDILELGINKIVD
ncbi:MAG TPA: ATP phosphoribosyltransferase [Candidatus Acidoferrum sp.]|nr:ATP phosphoribosyltransferase [Candidatus Acidoferrum sp.]